MGEATGFLYPFLEGDERDAEPLLADLARSAAGKWRDSVALRQRTLADSHDVLELAAADMAARFGAGGMLLTFGNGGSATDAGAAAALFSSGGGARPGLPARSLADDPAVITALANDIGFDGVFSRQLMAVARSDDIVLGLSTSGSSQNLLAAFAEAARRGLLTLGICGYDGGRMGASSALDYCVVVRSDSVHRIQEVQTAVVADLWRRVHAHLSGQAQ